VRDQDSIAAGVARQTRWPVIGSRHSQVCERLTHTNVVRVRASGIDGTRFSGWVSEALNSSHCDNFFEALSRQLSGARNSTQETIRVDIEAARDFGESEPLAALSD